MHKEVGRETKIAARILAELDKSERSLRWLSRRSEIPYSTLYQKVKRAPGTFTVDDLIRVSDALDVDVRTLVAAA